MELRQIDGFEQGPRFSRGVAPCHAGCNDEPPQPHVLRETPQRLERNLYEIWRDIESICNGGFNLLVASLEREIRIKRGEQKRCESDRLAHEEAIRTWHKRREEMTPKWMRHLLGMKTPHEDPPSYLVEHLERAKNDYWKAHQKAGELDRSLLLVQYVQRRVVVRVAERSLTVDEFQRWQSGP